MMVHAKSGLVIAMVVFVTATATNAQVLCSAKRADISALCPQPVPYTGPKKLTPTSRNMPTVGTPGLYKNYGSGYDVRVFLGHNGTGYQNFSWQE